MSKKYDVVSLGEAMVEFNQRRHAADCYLQGYGGDTSNVVISAARQGAASAYVSRIGADAFGERLLALWRAEGVDTSGVETDQDAPTGVYFVHHDEQGHHFSYRRAGSAASKMAPQCLPHEQLGNTRWLHVSGITQAISASSSASVVAAIALARKSGAAVSYDPNLRLALWPLDRARGTITRTISLSDLFLPSLDEAELLCGQRDPAAVFAWARAFGARAMVLKCGAGGAWYAAEGGIPQLAPAHRVEPVDATGAGDCFDGSLLARLAAGDTLADAVAYANVGAALSTQGQGAVQPIPYRDDVLRALAAR